MKILVILLMPFLFENYTVFVISLESQNATCSINISSSLLAFLHISIETYFLMKHLTTNVVIDGDFWHDGDEIVKAS